MIGGGVSPAEIAVRKFSPQEIVDNLTPTTQATSVTDPITGHVYSFVAADGTTPEARTVGQYQSGHYFVLGGTGNPVRIGSITPVSTSVSTAAYTRPNQLDDTATVGSQTRWMHGAMVNPWQGVVTPGAAPVGFDNYYGGAQPAISIQYDHSLNVDPGATGSPLSLEEGSVVKAESFTSEGGHAATDVDKTRLEMFSCLTVVPEIPAANSFRPPIRGTDKRSYWTTDDIDIAAKRRAITGGLISGLNRWTAAEINASGSLTRLQAIQQSFIPWQEQARRWNPGARNVRGGCLIYGNDHYFEWSKFFATFYSAELTDAEVTDVTYAAVQAGIDIYGLLNDGSYYFAWQAHHAGRKGLVMAAGHLLENQDILDQCDADVHPEHFGVDDAYTGYITQDMIDSTPGFVKGYYQHRWEQEQLGLAEWAYTFTQAGLDPESSDQIQDASFFTRSYQVLSFDKGAMFQLLWGMLTDPTAQYYKPAYFDFADRFLAVRFGDLIDGVWDSSGDATSTNNVFSLNGGNWWSINPTAADVQNMKRMRDACPRAWYVSSMIPEALPPPDVSHDGTSGYLDIDFNDNDIRIPQNKDASITGYDLRWVAYAGDADVTGGNGPVNQSSPNYIGRYEWQYENDITLPYQLTGVPRDTRIMVQLRMRNVNGDGPWLDSRRQSSYAFNDGSNFDPLGSQPAHAKRFTVPDIAAFDRTPLNWGLPSISPEAGATTGATLSGDAGIWTEDPAATAEYQWQVSDSDTSPVWSDISGATSIDFVLTAAQENKFLRLGVRKTDVGGTSAWAYSDTPVPAFAPAIRALTASAHGGNTYSPGDGALGGKRLMIWQRCRTTNPITDGGSIGSYTFGASERVVNRNSGTDSSSRERSLAYLVDVPDGETATDIVYNASDGTMTSAAYVLDNEMIKHDSTSADQGTTQTIDSVAGGAAFWSGRADGWVNFVSSANLVAHDDNPAANSKWAFAHSFTTPDGTVSVTFSRQFASNTTTSMLSLENV